MTFLRRQLNDPELADGEKCGRCDNCTGAHYDATVDESAAEETRQRLMRPGVEITPRWQWPSGLAKLGVSLSGKISEEPGAGRAIGRLTDLGWGARLRAVLDGPDAEAPDDLVRAAVDVLAAWKWDTRPTAVMGLDSERHPLLIESLVARLAELGRLTNLGSLAYAVERRPVTAANSAYRVAALDGSWEMPDLSDLGGPLLLVDDVIDSGWTMTMAARVLRQAGAPEVLPFAIAAVS
jgi:ATP-dependent DNA helicase RecQ